jgi:hypothetical protein
MSDDELDELIDRWHAMADLDRHAVEEEFGPEAVALLQAVVRYALGEEDIPYPLDASEFARHVTGLRESERAWSRRLGEAIVQSAEIAEAGNKEEAVSLLDQFISRCPWQTYREMADTHREEFL